MNTLETTKTVHFSHPYLADPTHPLTINLIGCGGTGSLILSRLARLDAALRQLQHPGLHVTTYDGDVVEKHNIGRQNFTPADIEKNKAYCLTEKINLAYGLHWEAVDQFVTKKNYPKANITLTAVDNAEFRMITDEHFKNYKSTSNYTYFNTNLYWLDTGNGKDFGQVILSTVQSIKQPKKSKFNKQKTLPTVVDIFGDMNAFDSEETQGIESCSFVDSIRKQDLFINDAIAVNAATLLWKLFTSFSLEYHGMVINQSTLVQKGIKVQKI